MLSHRGFVEGLPTASSCALVPLHPRQMALWYGSTGTTLSFSRTETLKWPSCVWWTHVEVVRLCTRASRMAWRVVLSRGCALTTVWSGSPIWGGRWLHVSIMWGLPKPISSDPLFPHLLALWKHHLNVICQILTRLEEFYLRFFKYRMYEYRKNPQWTEL